MPNATLKKWTIEYRIIKKSTIIFHHSVRHQSTPKDNLHKLSYVSVLVIIVPCNQFHFSNNWEEKTILGKCLITFSGKSQLSWNSFALVKCINIFYLTSVDKDVDKQTLNLYSIKLNKPTYTFYVANRVII